LNTVCRPHTFSESFNERPDLERARIPLYCNYSASCDKPRHGLRSTSASLGFDHGIGHPLLFLDDAKAPNYQKNNGFNGLGNYSEWPKVAGVVIQALFCGGKTYKAFKNNDEFLWKAQVLAGFVL
jgi:hypothetical protein